MSDDLGPELDQVNIVVSDMGAAVDFYRLLGVSVPDSPPGWSEWDPHHRELAAGEGVDASLDSSAFASDWNGGWPAGSSGVVIGFRVAAREEVDELHDRVVAAGHRSQQAPYDAFWGARYAVVEDPAGNAVGIMSPADDAHRKAPPEPPS